MNQCKNASSYKYNYFKIQDPKNIADIKPFQIDLESCLVKEFDILMKSINDLRSELETLKSEVLHLDKNKNVDLLKKKMLGMETKISNLKEGIKEEKGKEKNYGFGALEKMFGLVSLLEGEIILLKEIQFTETRMVERSKPITSQLFKMDKPSNYKVQRAINGDSTIEFQKFVLSSGGHYGGWHEQDHLLFLRERNKHKGKKKFLSVVHSLIPELSYDEISEHEKWYIKYESIKNQQKEAIQKWKSEREMQQKEKKEQEEKNEKIDKPVKKDVRQQRDIAERIKEWKNRQLQMRLEEKEKQNMEKQKLREEEKKRKELYKRKKSAVNEYKAQKLRLLEENLTRPDFVQTTERKTRNYFLLKAFRFSDTLLLEDAKFIEKKKMIRLQLESKAKEKVEKMTLTKSSLEEILSRDPQRIFQPTFIWTRHCLEKREQVCPVFNLNAIPRLAIPEWRRELK